MRGAVILLEDNEVDWVSIVFLLLITVLAEFTVYSIFMYFPGLWHYVVVVGAVIAVQSLAVLRGILGVDDRTDALCFVSIGVSTVVALMFIVAGLVSPDVGGETVMILFFLSFFLFFIMITMYHIYLGSSRRILRLPRTT